MTYLYTHHKKCIQRWGFGLGFLFPVLQSITTKFKTTKENNIMKNAEVTLNVIGSDAIQ